MHIIIEKGIQKTQFIADKLKLKELNQYTQNLLMPIDKKVLFIKDEKNYNSKEGVMKIADLVALENNRSVKVAIGEKAPQIEEAMAKYSINPSERRFAGVVLADAKAEYNKELKLAKQNEKHYANNNTSHRGL